MIRILPLLATCLLVGPSLGLAAQPAEHPLAGSWKITVLPRGAELTLWLVQFSEKDGKLDGKIIATGFPEFKGSRIKDLKLENNILRLTIEVNDLAYDVVGVLPKGEAQPKTFLGSNGALGRRDLVRFDRTDAKALTPETAQVLGGPAAEAFDRAYGTAEPKEREAAFREIIKKFAGHFVAFHAAMQLVEQLAQQASLDSAIRQQADEAVKLAEPYGREMQLQAMTQIAQQLVRSDKYASLGVAYAEQAERMLQPSDSVMVQGRILKALVAGLTKAGNAGAVKDAEARLEKVTARIDEEYLKTALPFKPEKYAGREGTSRRTLLLELFTGTQCPPCVAADLACDAVLQRYSPSEVVLLQYHLHIPGPDPLTSPDSEKRALYYLVDGTPVLFINGQEGPSVAGFRPDARDRFQTLRRTLDARLEGEPGAKLQLSASRQGSLVDVQVKYDDLKRTGDEVKLRMALVEDRVRYAAPNGQRFHYQVVRGFIGGVAGTPLKMKSGTHAATIDTDQLRTSLGRYLAEFGKVARLPDDERPLDLQRLRVVAFIQDDKSREVFQAAQVDLPAERSP